MLHAIGRQLVCYLIFGSLASVCIAADGLVLSGLALTSQSRVVPGQVLVLSAGAGNVSEQPVDGTVVLTIDEFPNLQSARQVTLQPGQNEQYELFFPLPERLSQFERIHLVATMFVRDGGREVIVEHNGAPAVSTLTLPVTQGSAFGMAMEAEPREVPYWYWPPALPQSSYELAVAARIDAGGKRTSSTFEMQSLPLNQVQWDGLDLFVIASPTPLEDPAAVEVMRRYLARGGRLWVMLDKIPSQLLRPLLGANQTCEAVERVELNDFSIDVEGLAPNVSQVERHISSERDLSMVRVLHSGGQVTHRVDGWPVAITMDIGYGQLYITTLDSFAWIVPRGQQLSSDPLLQSAYQMRQWGTQLAVNANEPPADLPLPEPVEYPLRLIGNPVVPKTWVATALLGFCGALAGLVLCLAYSGRLTILGTIAPGMALVASLGLLLAASWVRRDIPESVSRLQLVEFGDDGSFATIREQAAVYLSTTADMHLSSTVDGIMRTSGAASSGVQRLVIDDLHKWHVGNRTWPPGAWRYNAGFAIPTQKFLVNAELTDQGLELQLPTGLPSPLEDPVLSFVTGDFQLCDVSDAGLRVNNQIKLDAGHWISDSIISNEQQRRMEIYQKFFEPNDRLRRPSRRLYGWTNLWPTSSWNRELKQQGSALVALPVRLQRPSIGQDVMIPHGLVQLQRVASQGGVTSIFNDGTGEWRKEVAMATQAEMEFVLPVEVVPLAVTAIDFQVDVTAPRRTVTIDVMTDTGPVEIVELVNPSIPWQQTVSDPAVLEAFQYGHLPFRVSVSDLDSAVGNTGATSIVTWQIEKFHISVHGRLLPNSSLTRVR